MVDPHPIAIEKAGGRIRIVWRGHVVADTQAAVILKEHVYPGVVYVPRADADMRFFERSARETTCPYKGVANYFSLRAESERDDNAVWTYETPKPAAAGIREHLAFYPDKVEIQRESV